MKSSVNLAVNTYMSSFMGLGRKCWEGIILNFFESILTGVYYFLPIYFIQQLKIDLATAGVIISFYGIGAIIGGYLGGKISDCVSPNKVCIGALFIQIFVFLSILKLKSIWLLSLDTFCMGVASYAFLTANYVWVLEQCAHDENKKLKVINLNGIISNLALGISVILVSQMRLPDFIYISCVLLSIFLLYVIFSEFLNKNQRIKPVIKVDQQEKDANKKLFYWSLMSVFLMGIIIFQANTTYSFFIKQKFPEYGLNGIGILFALNSFLVVLLSPLISFIDNKNKIRMMGWGTLLLGQSMLLLCFVFSFWVAIVACIVNTIGEILFFSVSQLICYNNAAISKKGAALGLYRMIYALSRVVAPAGGTFLYQAWGANSLWLTLGLIGIVSFFVSDKLSNF